MPLYKGSGLIAGEEGDSKIEVDVKRIKSGMDDKQSLEILNEAWKWRNLRTTIIYFNELPERVGIIDKNSIVSSHFCYINLTSCVNNCYQSDSFTYLRDKKYMLRLTLSTDDQTVTSYTSNYYNKGPDSETNVSLLEYLSVDTDYKVPYVPKYNGSPATKKYVDDSVKSVTNVIESDKVLLFDFANTDMTEMKAVLQEALDLYWDNKSVALIGQVNNPSFGEGARIYFLSPSVDITIDHGVSGELLNGYPVDSPGTYFILRGSELNKFIKGDSSSSKQRIEIVTGSDAIVVETDSTYKTVTGLWSGSSFISVDSSGYEIYALDGSKINIYHWDGKSSTDNPNNIDLWQEIFDVAKTTSVLVYATKEDQTNASYSSLIIVSPKMVENKTSGSIVLYGVVSNISEASSSSLGKSITINRPSTTLTINNSKVTNVSAIAVYNSTPGRFLPTNSTSVSSFTPTYDYHPATKKYVDDVTSNAAESLGVYYWDGKSNTDNPDNIDLWQKIIDTAKTRTVLIYSSNETTKLSSTKSVFVISQPDIIDNSTLTFFGVVAHAEGGTAPGNAGSNFNIYRPSVKITLSGTTVTKVYSISQINNNICYLSTNQTNSQFTPTTDDDPTTKKYVDDEIDNLEYKGEATGLVSVTITNIDGIDVDQSGNGVLLSNNDDGFVMNSAELFVQDPSNVGEPSGTLKIELIEDQLLKNGSNISMYTDLDHYSLDKNQKMIEIDESTLSFPYSINISDNLNDPNTERWKIKITRILGSSSTVTNGTTYLSTNNTNSYNPVQEYNPATKKYVDDNLINISKTKDAKDMFGQTRTVEMYIY